MTVFLMCVLLALLFGSVPMTEGNTASCIFVALSVAVLASMLIFTGMDPMVLAQRMFGGLDKFSLMTAGNTAPRMSMPFFMTERSEGIHAPRIFAANLMDSGGLSKVLGCPSAAFRKEGA